MVRREALDRRRVYDRFRLSDLLFAQFRVANGGKRLGSSQNW
jgi:hypothetical protein